MNYKLMCVAVRTFFYVPKDTSSEEILNKANVYSKSAAGGYGICDVVEVLDDTKYQEFDNRGNLKKLPSYGFHLTTRELVYGVHYDTIEDGLPVTPQGYIAKLSEEKIKNQQKSRILKAIKANSQVFNGEDQEYLIDLLKKQA